MRFKSFVESIWSPEDNTFDHLADVYNKWDSADRIPSYIRHAYDLYRDHELIGHGTHHTVSFIRPADEKEKDEIEGFRKHLLSHGIEHEFSHNEGGYPTFYVPAKDHVTEETKLHHKSLWHILDRSFGDISPWSHENDMDNQRHSIVYPALKGNEPTRWFPQTDFTRDLHEIGATTHHIVDTFGTPDKDRPTHLQRISDHLKKHGVQNEIATNEHERQMIYVPVHQSLNVDHRGLAIEAIDMRTPSEIIASRNPNHITYGQLSDHLKDIERKTGKRFGQGIDSEAPSEKDKIGFSSHHKIPFWTMEDKYRNLLSSELSKRNVKHEISKDEKDNTVFYIPVDQS